MRKTDINKVVGITLKNIHIVEVHLFLIEDIV